MKRSPSIHRVVLVVALIISTAAGALANAGIVMSDIVAPGDKTLTITVGERRFIRIVNFVQESGTTRGLLAVTRNNGKAAFVLTATSATEPETQKDLLIAGPATVTIAPVEDGKLFISYRLAKNEH